MKQILFLLLLAWSIGAKAIYSIDQSTLAEGLSYKWKYPCNIYTCKIVSHKKIVEPYSVNYKYAEGYTLSGGGERNVILVDFEIEKVHYGITPGKKIQQVKIILDSRIECGNPLLTFQDSKVGDKWLIYSFQFNDSTFKLDPTLRSFQITEQNREQYRSETTFVEMLRSIKSHKADTTFTYNNPNGTIAVKGSFEQGVPSSYWDYYDTAGHIKTRGYFVSGRQASTWTEYNLDSSRAKETVYENGSITHNSWFFPDGRFVTSSYIQERDSSKLTESTIEFFACGRPEKTYRRTITHSTIGILSGYDGFYEEYFPNGQTRITGKYYMDSYGNSLKCGLWITTHEDGSLDEKIEYGPCK